MIKIQANHGNTAEERTSMQLCIWILIVAVGMMTLPSWSYAQRDPQVGPSGLIGTEEFFNSDMEGSQNICFKVVALRPPDPKLGRYFVRFSIYISSPEEGVTRLSKALTRLAIDGKDIIKLEAPSDYVGGSAPITTGKHTISFRVSHRARVRLVMVMQTRQLDNVNVAEVKRCLK